MLPNFASFCVWSDRHLPVLFMSSYKKRAPRIGRPVTVEAPASQGCCNVWSVVLQAVKVLAGDFLEQHPSYGERVGALMLGLLLHIGLGAAGSKLPVAALKAIKRINHPLLEGEWNAARLSPIYAHAQPCIASCFTSHVLAHDVSMINNC